MKTELKAGLLAVVLVAMLVAACGGGDDDDAPPGSQDNTAKSYLLTVQDFPTGWAENNADDDESNRGVERCADAATATFKTGRVGLATSGDFGDGGVAEVSHTVALYESPELARASVDCPSQYFDCLVKAISDGKLDNKDVKYSKGSSAPFPSLRLARIASHIGCRCTPSSPGEKGFGSEGDVYLSVVYVQSGSAAFSLLASDVLSPFDSSMMEGLAKKAAAKMPK